VLLHKPFSVAKFNTWSNLVSIRHCWVSKTSVVALLIGSKVLVPQLFALGRKKVVVVRSVGGTLGRIN